MTEPSSSNVLGLNFDNLHLNDSATSQDLPHPQSDNPPPDIQPQDPAVKDKKTKPYVNPERVKTGGSQRDKLSEEALTERMARIRQQNEKIKQRRIDVQADEDAFRKSQEVERLKLAHNRKKQEDIDRARDQNAKRKMDKAQSREWDSGKPAVERKTSASVVESQPFNDTTENYSEVPSSWIRGSSARGGRGRGRSRGRGTGRGVSSAGTVDTHETDTKTTTPVNPVTSALMTATENTDMLGTKA